MKRTLSPFPSSVSARLRSWIGGALAFLLLVEPALANAAAADLWADRRRATATQLAALPATLPALQSGAPLAATSELSIRAPHSLANFSGLVPDAPGRVTRSVRPNAPSRPPIILLQDVHGSAEAQKNLGEALSSLIKAGRVTTVALEGASGAIDLSHYARFADREALRLSTDYLSERFDLSGPAHRLINLAPAPTVVGVEDLELYQANGAAVQRAAADRAAARERLKVEQAAVRDEANRIFSPRLTAFSAAVSAFRDGRASLRDHALTLSRATSPAPVMVSFLEAARLEQDLDFRRAESQRARVLERLAAAMTPAEIQSLASDVSLFRLGQRTPAEFYSAFESLCRSHRISLADAPAFAAYVRYTVLADGIDGELLWAALKQQERAAFAALTTTDEERRLVDRGRRLFLTERLIELSLTNDEWAEWKPGDGASTLAAFEDFYRRAEERDAAMSERVENARGAVALVVGGFHTRGLADRLSRSGHPVLVWTPEIRKIEPESATSSLGYFAREKTPLEDLLQGEQLFLAPPPFRGSAQLPALIAGTAADPARAVRDLWPNAGFQVRVDEQGAGARRVEISRGGKTAAVTVARNAERITRFERAAPPFSLGLLPIWRKIYSRLERDARELGRRRAPPAFVAAAGFLEEVSLRALLQLGVAGLSAGAVALGVVGIDSTFMAAAILGFAVLFSTALHPDGLFRGSVEPRALRHRDRAVLFALALGIGVLQVTLVPVIGFVPALLISGGAHAVYNAAAYLTGGILAMARQRGDQRRRLAAVLASRDTHTRVLRELDDAALREHGTNFLAAAKIGEMSDEKIGWGVALFSEAARRAAASEDVSETVRPFIGGVPSDRQVEAMLAMIGNRRIVGMRPSEGKTLAVALSAFIIASTGRKVEVHDWNNQLTMRDGQVAGAIVSRLGMVVGVRLNSREHGNNEVTSFRFDPEFVRIRRAPHLKPTNGGSHTQANLLQATRDMYAEADIVYGPYDRMIFDWMEDWYATEGVPLHTTAMPGWVLTEESDTPLIDSAQQPLVAAVPLRSMTPRREMFFRTIYGFAQSLHPHEDFKVQPANVRFASPAIRARRMAELRGLLEDRNVRPLETDRLEDLLLAALDATYLFRKDHEYFVINRRIVIRDPMTGEAKQEVRWARGLHTFVEIKEAFASRAGRDERWVADESSIQSIMTTQTFYNLLPEWSGVAGVLDGATRLALEEKFEVEPVVFEPVFESLLVEREPRYFRTVDEKLTAIVRAAVAIRRAGRPVLVNAHDPAEARAIYARLESALPHATGRPVGLRIVDGRDEKSDQFAWDKMGDADSITIAAQVVSRGHEIKLDDSLYEPVEVDGWGTAAGLTVINTSRSIPRLEAQVMNRAGRRGRPGTYALMEHLEENELLSQYAADELRLLLSSGDSDAPLSEVNALFDIALQRSALLKGEAEGRLNGFLRQITIAQLQFEELARLAVTRGEDAVRLYRLSTGLVHRANAAVQTGDAEAFASTLAEFKREIRFLSDLLHEPGLSFADHLSVGERLRLLRELSGNLTQEAIAAAIGISERSYHAVENNDRDHPLTSLAAIERYYVETRRMNRVSVRRALGRLPASVLLPRLRGLPVNEVLIALRENEWITRDDMGTVANPSITGTGYHSWETGPTVPTTEQRSQIAAHFAAELGYDYREVQRVLGIGSPADIVRELRGRPFPEVMRGLRGDLSAADVAEGIGVSATAVLLWEKDTRPRDQELRSVIDHYASKGFTREDLKSLLGVPTAGETEAAYADKTPFEVLELLRLSGPYNVHEWVVRLGVSVTGYRKWRLQENPVPSRTLRAAERILPSIGLSQANFRAAVGLQATWEALEALRGQSMARIIRELREITGETQDAAATAVNIPLGRYKHWEKDKNATRPVRADRLRLVAHYAVHHRLPRQILRELLDIRSVPELIASATGRPLTESIPMFQLSYDMPTRTLAAAIGIYADKVYETVRDGVRHDDVLHAIAIYFHDHHHIPIDQMNALVGLGQPVAPAAPAVDNAPPTGPPADSGGDAPATGVWSVWRGLYDAVQRAAAGSRHRRGILTSFVMVVGAIEELIARPLLGVLLITGVPGLGGSGPAAFAIASLLYAVLFATVLHRTGFVGNDPTPRALSARQRLRLFALASGIGVLQFFLPLPWYALLPVLGGAHAIYNLWAFNSGAVLGMATPPILDDAATVLRSKTSSLEEKIAAVRIVATTPDAQDLPILREALFVHKNDEILAPAIIRAMAEIRRTGVLNVRQVQNEDLVGIVWHAVRDLGLDRNNFDLTEQPEGGVMTLEYNFPVDDRLDVLDQLVRNLESLYRRKNDFISPIITSWVDPDKPEGTHGTITIQLNITASNVTDFQRGLGMLDFAVDPNGRFRPLHPMEVARKLEERVWMFLRAMNPLDPAYLDLVTDLYGDGTEEMPGLLVALRNTADHGTKLFVKVESTPGEDGMFGEARGEARISLNDILKLAENLPMFTHFIPERGIQRWGFLARAAGPHFTVAFLKGLFRGKVESDHMVFISHDTLGYPVTVPIRERLGELVGITGRINPKTFMTDDGSVKNYTLVRLATLQFLRERYYLRDPASVPNVDGTILYRRTVAWHDSRGMLHELLPVFQPDGKLVARVHRVNRPIPDMSDRKTWVDPAPTVPDAVWVDANGAERPFSPQELAAVRLPPAREETYHINAVNAVYQQMKNSPFLSGLKRKDDQGMPVVPKVVVVDEVGVGTFDFLAMFAIHEGTYLDEDATSVLPDLALFRRADPSRLSEAQGRTWDELEQAQLLRRETPQSVDVEIFIGKPRMYGMTPPSGYPSLVAETIARFYSLSTEQAEEVIETTSMGANEIPHAYRVDDRRIKGQPILGEVPLRLETPAVRSAAYLVDLLTYNGVVQYYRYAYRQLAAVPLIALLRDASVPKSVHDVALEALADFSFKRTIEYVVEEATAHADIVHYLDPLGSRMLRDYLIEAFAFTDTTPISLRDFETAHTFRPLLAHLAAESNPLTALRSSAATALALLNAARPFITVLGLSYEDYRRLSLSQIDVLRKLGHYPAPIMNPTFEGRLNEFNRLLDAYGAGEVREVTYAEALAMIPVGNSEPESEQGWFNGGLASIFFPLFDAPDEVPVFRIAATAILLAVATVALTRSRAFRRALRRAADGIRRSASFAGNFITGRRERSAARALVSALLAAREGDVAATAAALNDALRGAEAPLNVGQNPIAHVTAAVTSGELDRDRLAAAAAGEWKRQTGESLSTEQSFALFARAALASGREGPLPLTVSREPAGTVWVLDDSNADRLQEIIATSTGKGQGRRLLIVTASAALAERALTFLAGQPADGVDVVVGSEAGVIEQRVGGASVKLSALESVARRAWGEDYWQAARLRVLAPAMAIDVDGLDSDSRIANALFIILDALRSTPLPYGSISELVKLSALIGRQA